jgi:CSLREA domain-containing protein
MARVARRSHWGLLGCLVLLMLISGGVSLRQGEAATTIKVTSLADPGDGTCTKAECTLREAIAATQAGDSITFDPALFAAGAGTLTLTAGELVLDHDVTITGPDRRLLIISGNNASRVIRIAAGVVTIQKVSLTRGRAGVGGGIYNSGTLTLRHTLVGGNAATNLGGGIYNSGTLTLRPSTVSGNTTDGFDADSASYGGCRCEGGGIYNSGTLALAYSTVRGNSVASNGIYASNEQGGGINNKGTLTLRHTLVGGNVARKQGGGIYNSGTLRLRRSTVSGNSARYDSGGGLFNTGTGRLTLMQSTVSGNSSQEGGGGVTNRGTLALVQCTVSGNDGRSGGLSNGDTLTLYTTIVVGNTTKHSPSDCFQSSNGVTLSLGHNLTGAGTGCPSDAAQGDVTVDPTTVFTQVLKPLGDYGGPTFTHALWRGSPAIDAGDPDQCSGTDQRGVPRPQGEGCDIGAVEREVP